MKQIFVRNSGKKISDKLSAYGRELAFAMTASSTWSDRFVLLQHSIRFHFQNWLGGAVNNSSGFSVKLRIDREEPTLLALRTFRGDLFVLYEVLVKNVYHIATSLLRPEDVATVVDCGANIGITSLFFASRYPRAKIYSIEPDPDNFNLLQRNVGHASRIIPIQACVTGRSVGAVRFTTDQAAWGNRMTASDNGSILVPAITLEELCCRNHISHIDLLKLDIEGAEEQLFEDGNFLNSTEHIIIELHGSYSFDRFKRDVTPYGFAVQQPRPPETYMITARRKRL